VQGIFYQLVTKFNLVMGVFQALLDDLRVLIEAELLGRHYQVELGNEKNRP
jgi:hypothetical protein